MITVLHGGHLSDREVDARLEQIRGLPISDAIDKLNELFWVALDVRPSLINCGLCCDYAELLCELVPGCESFWGDDLADDEDNIEHLGWHCFVRYAGRYYDAEYPFGVANFRVMSAYANSPY